MADSAAFKPAPASSDHLAAAPRAAEQPLPGPPASRPRPAGGLLRPSQVPLPGETTRRAGSPSLAGGQPHRGRQRLRPSGAPAGAAPALARPSTVPARPVQDVVRGPGQPLAAPPREEMQARPGADFSPVRAHTDGAAPAAGVAARAAGTSGSHIGTGDGGAGKHTLGDELSHVSRPHEGPVAPRPPAQQVGQVLSSPGRPLRPDLASSMGEALSADFSAVRIHDGPDAAASARAVGASMYTSGTHIVAGDAHPGFDSSSGRRALAHELYHVKQQSEGPVAGSPADDGLALSDPSDPYERAAQRTAEGIGGLAHAVPRGQAAPQRSGDAATRAGAVQAAGMLPSAPRTADREPPTPGRAAAAPARPARRPGGRITVQRLVGFEVELSVPTFGPGKGLTWPDTTVPPGVDSFLTGGLQYGEPFGFISTTSSDNIGLSPDHNVLHQRGKDVYDAITALGMAPSEPYVPITDLEYGTPALDEMARGSDARFQALAAAIDHHAGQIFTANPQAQLSVIPGTTTTGTGVPVPDFHTMLGGSFPVHFASALDAFIREVRWYMNIQATAGVMPTGLPSLFEAQAQAAAEPAPAAAWFRARAEAARAVVNGVNSLWQENPFKIKLQDWIPAATPADQEAFRGLLLLGLSYTIGNALSQTSLLRSTAKNAVELLIKTADISSAHTASTDWMRNNPPPLDFINYIALWFHHKVPQTSVAHWKNQYRARDSGRDALYGQPGVGPVEATAGLLTRLLTGTGGLGSVKSGSPLGLDPVSGAITGAAGGDAARAGQGGLPLEFRWIRTAPAAAGQLWPAFGTILTQVREANLRRLPDTAAGAIRADWAR